MQRFPAEAAFLLVAALAGPALAGAPEMPLALPSGKSLTVELMLTPEDQARGLMFRESLPQDRGLLFVFPVPGQHSFWMKNCRFPIDMVFLDEDARVTYVAESVPPCKKDPCPSYGPSGPMKPTKYVLEINAGQAAREKLIRGSRLDVRLRR
jgi:uncharacterized membrane protein (UPF0127 family)